MPVLPDILLLALGLGLMVFDLVLPAGATRPRRAGFHIAWIGLSIIFLSTFIIAGMIPAAIGEIYRINGFGLWLRRLFTLSALAALVLARPYFTSGANAQRPLSHDLEFTYILMFCTLGMFIVVSAQDLMTLFLGLELATVPLYVLTGFNKNDPASSEAGVKYIMTGSMSTAFMLFCFSYLYGVCGSTRLEAIGIFAASRPDDVLLQLAVIFMLAGIGFKLAMAPFHMWAPDVYAGAPAPAAAFLSVSSKAAAVAFLAIMLYGPLAPLMPRIGPVLILLAGLTMVVGNLGAMRQQQIRRFIAYSSIAQAGYLLMAFLGTGPSACTALVYYLFIYAAANYAFFFIAAIVGEKRGESIASLRGLSRESPALAAMLAVSMFSLAGIPPAAGFIGKFFLFASAAETGHYGLVVFAALNSTVSLYYYLLIVREAYITQPDPACPQAPLRLFTSQRIALVLLTAATLFLGLFPGLATGIRHVAAISFGP